MTDCFFSFPQTSFLEKRWKNQQEKSLPMTDCFVIFGWKTNSELCSSRVDFWTQRDYCIASSFFFWSVHDRLFKIYAIRMIRQHTVRYPANRQSSGKSCRTSKRCVGAFIVSHTPILWDYSAVNRGRLQYCSICRSGRIFIWRLKWSSRKSALLFGWAVQFVLPSRRRIVFQKTSTNC